MNPEILEKVLACPRLPSLPAVAVRVLELVQDENVSVRELADTISNDQALATRILRTVNSSFYGLRRPCSTINQAIVILGLPAVKTLALGFSLVGAISRVKADGFDYVSYWRRGLYTGIAARCIAKAAGTGKEEECFLGGLLQDVGMVAMHQALGAEYAQLLAEAKGDHYAVAPLEVARFETQHADIGSMLASRWRLPDELVMPIKYHERPTAAPAPHRATVQAVALGNIAADVLTAAEPAGPLTRFYTRAEEWFGLGREAAELVLRQITQTAREVARLLQVEAGSGPDAEAILAQAHQRLLTMTIPEEPAFMIESDEGGAEQGAPASVATRLRFDQTLVATIEQARAGAGPAALAIFGIDGLEAIAAAHGARAADGAMAAVGRRLAEAFAPIGATVYQFAPGTFAALMPRTEVRAATHLAEQARRRVHGTPLPLEPEQSPVSPVSLKTSVGLACMDPAGLRRLQDAGELVRLAEGAMQAARQAGGNTLRVYSPAAMAA